MLRRFGLLLALAVAVGGCTKVSMVDDVEFDLDFFVPWLGPSNEIHTPYVIGAGVKIYAESTDSHANMAGWTFDSSNPAVFAITSQDGVPGASTDTVSSLTATANAVGAGSSTLSLRDANGKLLTSQTVEVKIPDSAAVLAHGPLILGQPDSAAVVTAPRVVAGGTATFLVRWFAGGVELSGNGVLATDDATDLVTKAETTEFLVNRDWLEVTAPQTPGTRTLAILADGQPVTTLPVNVVAPSDIDHLQLAGGDEAGAKNGAWMVVLAEAFDAANNSILGVDYTFDVDGTTQDGIGDLYRYEFESAMPQMLTAHSATLSASAMIHAGVGYVDSTNNVGCSMGGAHGGDMMTIVCAGLVLLVLRRRSRGSPSEA